MLAAIYCRLSDEDKDKIIKSDNSESIDNQKKMLIKFAKDKGWDIYKIYIDDDYSGLDSDRPNFNEMIKDAEDGKFQIIICKTQSRFTRDMEISERYLHNKFLEWGIRFVTVVDGADTSNKNNKKSRQINALVNEWYSEDISESIKSVFRLKQQLGKFIGSFACYGYLKNPEDKNKLIVDEEAAEVVKLIFNLYVQGYGMQKIANDLNERGIKNPTEYKKSKGLNYKNTQSSSGLWSKTTVKRILKNEMYIGNMVQHKHFKVSYKSKKTKNINPKEWIVVPNTHEAIIDKQLFHKVQERIKYRTRISKNGKVHLFAGKVICMDCKSTMNKTNNGKNYVYLRCRRYALNTKKKLCSSHSIRLDVLEDLVRREIKNNFDRLLNWDEIKYEVRNSIGLENRLRTLVLKIKNTENDINDIQNAIKDLYLDKVRKKIKEEEFNKIQKQFLKDKRQLILRSNVLKKDKFILENNKNEELDNKVSEYKRLDKLNKLLIDELIDYIEIGQKSDGKQTIRIYWNF